jgi:hypothetical protein
LPAAARGAGRAIASTGRTLAEEVLQYQPEGWNEIHWVLLCIEGRQQGIEDAVEIPSCAAEGEQADASEAMRSDQKSRSPVCVCLSMCSRVLELCPHADQVNVNLAKVSMSICSVKLEPSPTGERQKNRQFGKRERPREPPADAGKRRLKSLPRPRFSAIPRGEVAASVATRAIKAKRRAYTKR